MAGSKKSAGKKTSTYVEPKGYFNADMLKKANEWERAHAKDAKKPANKSKKK